MPLDPTILLRGQTPDIIGPTLGLWQAGQADRQRRASLDLQREEEARLGRQADLDAQVTQAQLENWRQDRLSAEAARERDAAVARADRIARALAAVLAVPPADQPKAYEDALRELQAEGIETQQFPQTFDAAWVTRSVRQTQSVKDQLERIEPKPPATPVAIDTVDAQGRPVTRYDVPTVGSEYPKPPPAEPRLTFQPPAVAMVNGRRQLTRAGSDGRLYDMAGRPIPGEQVQPEPIRGPVATPPAVGSFEDYLLRLHGANPTAEQIETARRTYTSASRPGIEIDAEMPSDYRTALERALGAVPAIRRGSWVQTANRLWQEGNTNELREVIRQAATEAEDVTTKNQVRSRQATLAALDDMEDMLTELQAAGVPTNWLTGTVEDLARRLGTSTDPRFVALRTRLTDTLVNYRRAATGVAFSVRESADYERMFPSYRQTLPVNRATIQGLKRAMRTNDTVFWEQKLGATGARLVGALPPVVSATTPSAGAVTVTAPNGQTYTFPTQAAADQFKRAAGIP